MGGVMPILDLVFDPSILDESPESSRKAGLTWEIERIGGDPVLRRKTVFMLHPDWNRMIDQGMAAPLARNRRCWQALALRAALLPAPQRPEARS